MPIRFRFDSIPIRFDSFRFDSDSIPIPIRFVSDSFRCVSFLIRFDSNPIRFDSDCDPIRFRFDVRFRFDSDSIRSDSIPIRSDSIPIRFRFDSDSMSDSICFDSDSIRFRFDPIPIRFDSDSIPIRFDSEQSHHAPHPKSLRPCMRVKSLMTQCVDHINREHNVHDLCSAWPRRLEELVAADGERLKPA